VYNRAAVLVFSLVYREMILLPHALVFTVIAVNGLAVVSEECQFSAILVQKVALVNVKMGLAVLHISGYFSLRIKPKTSIQKVVGAIFEKIVQIFFVALQTLASSKLKNLFTLL
jgi:hypothetical protein